MRRLPCQRPASNRWRVKTLAIIESAELSREWWEVLASHSPVGAAVSGDERRSAVSRGWAAKRSRLQRPASIAADHERRGWAAPITDALWFPIPASCSQGQSPGGGHRLSFLLLRNARIATIFNKLGAKPRFRAGEIDLPSGAVSFSDSREHHGPAVKRRAA